MMAGKRDSWSYCIHRQETVRSNACTHQATQLLFSLAFLYIKEDLLDWFIHYYSLGSPTMEVLPWLRGKKKKTGASQSVRLDGSSVQI